MCTVNGATIINNERLRDWVCNVLKCSVKVSGCECVDVLVLLDSVNECGSGAIA